MSVSLRKINPRQLRIGIVFSEFNSFITDRLFKACQDRLIKNNILLKNITVLHVPGAFEVPVAALKLAKKRDIAAVICLGAVIKGETLHFDIVAFSAAQGIMQVSLLTEKPIVFGVLTTNTTQQALKRSQPKGENKGRESADVCLSMLNSLSKI